MGSNFLILAHESLFINQTSQTNCVYCVVILLINNVNQLRSMIQINFYLDKFPFFMITCTSNKIGITNYLK